MLLLLYIQIKFFVENTGYLPTTCIPNPSIHPGGPKIGIMYLISCIFVAWQIYNSLRKSEPERPIPAAPQQQEEAQGQLEAQEEQQQPLLVQQDGKEGEEEGKGEEKGHDDDDDDDGDDRPKSAGEGMIDDDGGRREV